MEINTTNSHLRGVLGNLGKLTSIRDTELLEQSLLRTLGPLLGLLDTELYRVDENQTVARVIYSHRSRVIDGDGEARIVERIEEVNRPGDLPVSVTSLIENVRLLKRPCTRRADSGFTTAYPLTGNDEVCGYFVFHRDREATATEDAVIRGVLEVFSNYYALLDLSLRDRLTGLLNRQALENSFDKLWNMISRVDTQFEPGTGRRMAPGHRYWLAMLDIDRFKQINDSFGHMVGDEILLLCGRLMYATFRATDLVYRYGGEEFVAIVAAENEDIAHNIFERVRLAIEAHHFPQTEHVTVSIGYAEVRPELLPVEVLSRADRSLYHAKQNGRNRTCAYHDLVRQGVFKETVYEEPELF